MSLTTASGRTTPLPRSPPGPGPAAACSRPPAPAPQPPLPPPAPARRAAAPAAPAPAIGVGDRQGSNSLAGHQQYRHGQSSWRWQQEHPKAPPQRTSPSSACCAWSAAARCWRSTSISCCSAPVCLRCAASSSAATAACAAVAAVALAAVTASAAAACAERSCSWDASSSVARLASWACRQGQGGRWSRRQVAGVKSQQQQCCGLVQR